MINEQAPMADSSRIVLGAMSGTSADGVDVAVTRISGHGMRMRAELVCLVSSRFAAPVRNSIMHMRAAGACSFGELAQTGRELTLQYARTARRAMRMAGIRPTDVACIAAHGQTLFHDPPLTIQWFDPSLCARETGCVVVSDFRRADCAAGGQGAPLVPFADYLMFRHAKRNRVLLNVGGIANITYLPAGGALQDVVAFDTGPGNCLSDTIAHTRMGKAFDAGGRLAQRGTPAEGLVAQFLQQNYFRKRYPKSTDGPAMIAAFGKTPRSVSTPDLLATACLCCARAVAMALRMLPGSVDEIIAAGGGMKNAAIARMLRQETGLPLLSTAQLDVPIEAREAMAFALLGAATLDGVPSNVPSVTGARHAAVLGSITPRPISEAHRRCRIHQGRR